MFRRLLDWFRGLFVREQALEVGSYFDEEEAYGVDDLDRCDCCGCVCCVCGLDFDDEPIGSCDNCGADLFASDLDDELCDLCLSEEEDDPDDL